MFQGYNSIAQFLDLDLGQVGPPGQSPATNGFYILDGNLARYSASQTGGKAAHGGSVKSYQEDAMGMANIPYINDPEKYFRDRFTKMGEGNQGDESGSTASMYYFDPERRTITTANLGDSRVYLVIKNPVNSEYKTILLTQDHNPSLERIKNTAGDYLQEDEFPAMEGNPGYTKYSIKHESDPHKTYCVGGAIGDNGFAMLRYPDIATFDIAEISKAVFAEVDLQSLEFIIVNACDGLTNDARDKNYDHYVTYGDNGMFDGFLGGGISTYNLSKLILQADEARGEEDVTGLAQYLVDDANENTPGDNISVSTFAFSGDELGASDLKPTLGMVFDGHSRDPDNNPSKVQIGCLDYMKKEIQELRALDTPQRMPSYSFDHDSYRVTDSALRNKATIDRAKVSNAISRSNTAKIIDIIGSINSLIDDPPLNIDNIDDIDDLCVRLTESFASHDGSIAEHLENLGIFKEELILGDDKASLSVKYENKDQEPISYYLRRKLFNASILKYQKTPEYGYKNRVEASKKHALTGFFQRNDLPRFNDVEDVVDFSRPFDLASIQTSNQVTQAIEFSVCEEVAALQLAVEENFDNPAPTTSYRGIGAKLNILQYADDSKALEISEIFSAGNQRFRIETGGEIATDPAEDKVLDAMQNALVTAIWIDGGRQEVTNLLALGDEGIKKITTTLRGEGKVKFEIEKGGERSTIECDNSKNKTAIFTPTDPRAPDTREKTSFTALHEGFSLADNGHYFTSCDESIKRGKLFTSYEYEDEDILKAFSREVGGVNGVESLNIPLMAEGMEIEGMSTTAYKKKNESGTTLAIFPGNTVMSEIAARSDSKEYYKLLIQSAKDSIQGEPTYPLRIFFPVNDFSNKHWATGEIYINGDDQKLIMNDPLIVKNTFSEGSKEAFAYSLQEILKVDSTKLKRYFQNNKDQRQGDVKSCGHIVAREMKKLFCGEQDLALHEPFASKLRIEDLKRGDVNGQVINSYHRLPSDEIRKTSPSSRPTSTEGGNLRAKQGIVSRAP